MVFLSGRPLKNVYIWGKYLELLCTLKNLILPLSNPRHCVLVLKGVLTGVLDWSIAWSAEWSVEWSVDLKELT